MIRIQPISILFMSILIWTGCGDLATQKPEGTTIEVDTTTIARHIQTLASDDFLGRKPFTEGETKTVSYLTQEFTKLGLAPGNGESYIQDVPLVSITGFPDQEMKVIGKNTEFALAYGTEFVAYTEQVEEKTSLENSELVFAGYGIVAPEYGWNDYDGLDVQGKTVLVLVNDPGFETRDSTLFKGETMTYYGRWTYKYEEAARQGAAGVMIIHETVPAGYPWMVVSGSWSGSKLQLAETAGYRCAVQGWVTRDAAIKLFAASSAGIKDYKKLALSEDFKPVPMGIGLSVDVRNEIQKDMSANVVAMIKGSKRPDEVIIYSAHWDHLGVGNEIDGDSIYNGAHDNATGTAALLAIAEAFSKQPQPDRTVVFLAVTAEEQGLLGSAHYAENPIFPAAQSVANINMDGLQAYGFMKDYTIVGIGQSEMDELAAEVADKQGRYIYPDPEPGKGYFFRSDHFNFAKIGIPALYGSGTYEAVSGGTARVAREGGEYIANRYHQPSDEYDPAHWQFGGMYQDANLMLEVGKKLANSEVWPKWKEGSEFKSIREQK